MGMNTPIAATYMATDMDDIQCFNFAGGNACMFTRRSPDKSTPNEDSIALIPSKVDNGAMVVADGLGGMRRGDLASAQVINSLVKSISKIGDNDNALRGGILNGVENANEAILNSIPGAASTVAIVEFQGHEIRPYHVGDSMTLITGQRGKIKYQSIAHSPVGYAVHAGLLHEDDAMYHEERHLISNAVGFEPMHVEIGPRVKLAARDTVLIASDGLFDNMHLTEIVETVRSGELLHAAETLVNTCRIRMTSHQTDLPHKPDDMSFILFRRNS